MLLAVLVAAAVVVGLQLGHSPVRSTAGVTVDRDGRVQAPVDLLGVRLQPPPGSAHPALSADRAAAICSQAGVGCRPEAGALTVALASATTDNNGLIQPDGSVRRTIDDTLVWAVIWADQCLPAGGQLPLPGQSSVSSPRPSACTDLVLVDAGSGSLLFHGSGS